MHGASDVLNRQTGSKVLAKWILRRSTVAKAVELLLVLMTELHDATEVTLLAAAVMGRSILTLVAGSMHSNSGFDSPTASTASWPALMG